MLHQLISNYRAFSVPLHIWILDVVDIVILEYLINIIIAWSEWNYDADTLKLDLCFSILFNLLNLLLKLIFISHWLVIHCTLSSPLITTMDEYWSVQEQSKSGLLLWQQFEHELNETSRFLTGNVLPLLQNGDSKLVQNVNVNLKTSEVWIFILCRFRILALVDYLQPICIVAFRFSAAWNRSRSTSKVAVD